jgi:hypothetical protein
LRLKVRFADLLLPLAILITPISAGIVTLYGRSTVVFDAFYNRVWQDESRSGLLAAVLGAAILIAVLTIASTRIPVEQFVGSRLFSTNFLMALTFVCLLSVAANYSSWGMFGVVKVLIFFWVTIVLFVSGITANSFKIASQLVLLSYLALMVFAIISPSNSWKPCREDKCTVAGSLLTSFFQSENSVSLYVLTTVYFLRFLQKRWHRGAGYFLALVLSSLSGSRIGVIAVVLVVLLLVFKKTNILVWAPIAFLALSSAIFAFGTGADFTGRGAIFSAVREIWMSSPIFGVGPIATQLAFERGLVIGFVPYNEQTQVAHLLAQYGLLVLVLFVAVIGTLLRQKNLIRSTNSLLAITAPFLITSLAFVTESPASFTIDSPSFWVVAILFSKVAGKSSKDKLGEFSESVIQSANPYNRSPASPRPGTM